jgi:hypothetical protein
LTPHQQFVRKSSGIRLSAKTLNYIGSSKETHQDLEAILEILGSEMEIQTQCDLNMKKLPVVQ